MNAAVEKIDRGPAGNGPGRESRKILQFATFRLNSELFGFNILKVQEILLPQPITPVPLAPTHILGLISLRGQIVTVIDLRRRLDIDIAKPMVRPYHVVVSTQAGVAGFEVDQIGDVVDVPSNEFVPPPESVREVDSKFLEGVFPMNHEILSVLNVDDLLETS